MSVIPYGLISAKRIVHAVSKARLYVFYLGQKRARRITEIAPSVHNSKKFHIAYVTSRSNIRTKLIDPETLLLTAFYDVSGELCADLIEQAQAVGDIDRLEALAHGFPCSETIDMSYVCG